MAIASLLVLLGAHGLTLLHQTEPEVALWHPTAGVAIARKWGLEPNANDLDGKCGKDGALADGEHVRVVVLACPAGGLFVPAECATDAFDFVGNDGLAVAGAAQDDAALEIVIRHGEGDGADEERIIDWLGAVSAKIADFVPPRSEQGTGAHSGSHYPLLRCA